MRKQTKLAAVCSAAALLAIGVTMTSFAAGWTEESGSWAFYNKDGSAVTNEWKKSGTNWYWLDNDGLMAVDQIVEDGDNYYYVDANGVMVTNQWVQVQNADDSEEGAPANWWYYFQANGKAFKANESGNTSLKTINDKKYAFTNEGKMLFGWVDGNASRQTDDSAWKNCDYYMGGEDDGAAVIGWAELPVVDDDLGWDERNEESEDQNYWFYFQSNGKKVQAEDGEELKIKTINGKKYGFDENGRMVFDWTKTGSDSEASAATDSEAADYNYFNDRDNGARVSKGWFSTVPSKHMDSEAFEDEEEKWYYAYSEGKISHSEFRTINGKRYCFDNSGQMLTGLQAVYTDTLGRVWNAKLDDEDKLKDGTELRDGGTSVLLTLIGTGADRTLADSDDDRESIDIATAIGWANAERTEISDPAEDADGFGGKKKPTFGVFYFGDSDDGAIRTSIQSIEIDGESYTFYFKKDGDRKGEGVNGIKDNYLYQNGKRVKADKDNKYEAYFIASRNGQTCGAPSIGDDSVFKGHVYRVLPDDFENFDTALAANKKLYLVNTSGSITKGKKEVKDGNDMYYSVEDGTVKSYYEKDGNSKVTSTEKKVMN